MYVSRMLIYVSIESYVDLAVIEAQVVQDSFQISTEGRQWVHSLSKYYTFTFRLDCTAQN